MQTTAQGFTLIQYVIFMQTTTQGFTLIQYVIFMQTTTQAFTPSLYTQNLSKATKNQIFFTL